MRTTEKVLLLASWSALSVSYLIANQTPANGYELSIYESTPGVFWIGIVFSVVSSVYLIVFRDGIAQTMGYFVGILAIVGVVSLPYLRGYYFYGKYDPLNHLGTTKDFYHGTITPDEILYPGQHLLATVMSLLTGMSVSSSLLLLVTLFSILFVVSCTMVTKTMTNEREIHAIAMVAPLLLLPVLVIRIPRLEPTPTLLVLSLLPIGFFTILQYFDDRHLSNRLLTIVVLAGMTIFHPQQAVTFIFGLLLLVGYSLIINRVPFTKARSVAEYSRFSTVSLIGTVFVAVWISEQRGFSGAVAEIIIGLMTRPDSSGATPDGTGAETVGISILEILFKTFIVEIISMIVVLSLIIGFLVSRFRTSIPIRSELFPPYLVMCVPAGVFSVTFFLVNAQSQFIRYGSYLLVIVTIFLPIGLYWFVNSIPIPIRSTEIVGVLLLAGILVTIPALHPSPYIYQSNPQVTESQIVGYEKTFEYQGEQTAIENLYTSAYRYRNAIYGKAVSERGLYGMDRHNEVIRPKIPGAWRMTRTAPHFNDQNLPDWADHDTYLVTADSDYEERVELYNGLTYNESDFSYLDRDPQISKPIVNDEVAIYYVYASRD